MAERRRPTSGAVAGDVFLLELDALPAFRVPTPFPSDALEISGQFGNAGILGPPIGPATVAEVTGSADVITSATVADGGDRWRCDRTSSSTVAV